MAKKASIKLPSIDKLLRLFQLLGDLMTLLQSMGIVPGKKFQQIDLPPGTTQRPGQFS